MEVTSTMDSETKIYDYYIACVTLGALAENNVAL